MKLSKIQGFYYGGGSSPAPSFDQITIDAMGAAGIAYDATVYFTGTPQERTGIQLWDEYNKTVLNVKGIGPLNATTDFFSDLLVLHLCLDTDATANAVNWINPGTNDLVFSGSWTHGSGSGPCPDGSTGYAEYGLSPNDVDGANFCIGRYNGRKITGLGGFDISASIGNPDAWELGLDTNGNFYYFTNFSGLGVTPSYRVGIGFVAMNKTSLGTTQGWRQNQKYTASNTSSSGITTPFTLSARNVSGTKSVFDGGELQLNFLFNRGLSDAEMLAWRNICVDHNKRLSRRYKQTDYYGDSITFGTNASVPQNSWINLVTAGKTGWITNNQGLSGRTLQRAVPIDCAPGSPINLYDFVYNETLGATGIYVSETRDYAFIACINDVFRVELATYSPANYESQLTDIVDKLHNTDGFPYANIILGLLYYVNPSAYGSAIGAGTCGLVNPVTAGDFTLYNTAISNVATAKGCTLIDLNVGVTGTDGLHPDDAQMTLIANQVLAQITSIN